MEVDEEEDEEVQEMVLLVMEKKSVHPLVGYVDFELGESDDGDTELRCPELEGNQNTRSEESGLRSNVNALHRENG